MKPGKSKQSGARRSKSAQPKQSASPKDRRRASSSRGRRRIAENVSPAEPNGPQRLQKVMAHAGVASRRECEQLILTGRVEVDRQVVTDLGVKVDPQRQEIRVDGERINRARLVYLMVHKPVGVVSTNFDPDGRTRVIDLVPGHFGRLYTVGRLDKSSEGLILVTNDGELANGLTHPRFGIEKTYHVQVAGRPTQADLEKIREGVHLAEGPARPRSVRMKGTRRGSTTLEIVLAEGRNREIRRLMARMGHKVLTLRRVAMGGLRLEGLPAGDYRPLMREEVDQLYRLVRRRGNPTATAARRLGSSSAARRRLLRSPSTD
ncbi:MAG: pseudouridine synthase [Pirellulales bacterium]